MSQEASESAASVAVAKEATNMIKTAVTDNKLCKQFEPHRTYAEWDWDLKEKETLKWAQSGEVRVDVASHTTRQSSELASRSKVGLTVPMDIVVRKKFGPDLQDEDTGRIRVEEVDELMLLTQQLHLMFTAERLVDFECAVHESTEIVAAPITLHLRKLRQFTSLIRVIFVAHVSIPQWQT